MTFRANQRIPTGLRRKILDKYGHKCAICDVSDDVVSLELAHLVPISNGGEPSEKNLIILCPNCHKTLDRQPREIEFVSFITELLKLHPGFSEVRQEVLLGRETRYRADILVNRTSGGGKEALLIECKTPIVFAAGSIRNAISQLETYRAVYGDCRLVLAIPATLTEADLLSLRAANIEAWDLPYIESQFPAEIQKAPPSYYKALFLAQIGRPERVAREKELIDSLASCNPGKTDCYVYQALVGEILECLFTPPLGKPIPELSDKSEANRRDFIMPNYAESGFWSFLRQKYDADYIVIDAKNYTRKVKKQEVLQIANYLKPHGAGLFGLIVSRKGGDTSGCEHTLREQWMVHRKLILVLDDEDIKAMLMAKSDGRLAEDVLGQRIERFRLSM
ncbi:HNH endonuclease signature motif containing protein [Achromobacter mucicolens]|uniref:HNH endonuclease n=1 Tax=Achromobacter mucicolens TaxID=1389922 RepID=UPI0032093914